ncbi:hypothetical protein BRADI_3g08520v3 [Brachypodium distachyon]|uniref:Myb/SANT-like domain-containing protein n=1 Tax=Brachypodium distachyon TaxID=15368 RepID=A0A0Q3J7K3_BRADI|nr:hypothetical protein BRADI_3g08520v3 [Brachypodium distachyon]
MYCVVERQKASWNAKLEKNLVELLHEHNNSYHRGQNGWSRESWNTMASLFQKRHKHLNFSKSQLQDKEKDLKRDQKMIKAARMQSGVGWDDKKCRFLAGPHLWEICPLIKRYKNKAFPLYDLLDELHARQTADGKLSFTSTSEPSMEDEEETERGVQRRVQVDHDERRAQVEHEQVGDARVAADTTRNLIVAKGNKPKNRFVDTKEKEATKEDGNEFSITRCMAELRTLQEITPDEKLMASELFRIADNREMFVNLVADKDGTALLWIRRHIAKIA